MQKFRTFWAFLFISQIVVNSCSKDGFLVKVIREDFSLPMTCSCGVKHDMVCEQVYNEWIWKDMRWMLGDTSFSTDWVHDFRLRILRTPKFILNPVVATSRLSKKYRTEPCERVKNSQSTRFESVHDSEFCGPSQAI